jgi:transposase
MNSVFAQTGNQNVKVRIRCVNGKMTIETIKNVNNPQGCDQARALLEQRLGLGDQVESVTKRAPVEDKMLAPVEEETIQAPAEQVKKTL